MSNLPAVRVERLKNIAPTSKFGTIKKVLMSIGAWEAVSQGAAWSVDAAVKMFDGIVDGGVDPKTLERGDEVAQKIALIELAKQGVDLNMDLFDLKKMSKAILAKYPEVKSALSGLEAKVDASQPEAVTREGDDDLERLAYFKRMARACGILGLTGAQRFHDLYDLAFVVNSITRVNVEQVTKFEQMMGRIDV